MAISHNGRRLQSLSHPPPPPPPETPQPTPSVWTPMSRQWRCSMKNALARTLSHPPTPPEPPPTNTQRMNTYVTSMKMFHEERTSKNVITPPHPPPPKPPQRTPSVWTPMSRQWRCSMRNALARTLSHPSHPSTLGLYFWLLKRSFFGCWLGPFLVADSDVLGCWLGRSWLLTRTFLVADSVSCWLSCFSCWLGWLLTRSMFVYSLTYA